MTKAALLKFLEPFSDDITITISIDDGIAPERVDFDPIYKLEIDGTGIVLLCMENDEDAR